MKNELISEDKSQLINRDVYEKPIMRVYEMEVENSVLLSTSNYLIEDYEFEDELN